MTLLGPLTVMHEAQSQYLKQYYQITLNKSEEINRRIYLRKISHKISFQIRNFSSQQVQFWLRMHTTFIKRKTSVLRDLRQVIVNCHSLWYAFTN